MSPGTPADGNIADQIQAAATGVRAPSRRAEVTAAGLAAELASAARAQDGQLEPMFRAAQAAGWGGPATEAYLAQLAAVTQASGVIWLLRAILQKCGPGTADELARGLWDQWSSAAAPFGTAPGLPAASPAHPRPGAQP